MTTPKHEGTLLFVYNADSGMINGLIDMGRKYLQPKKYECQLCMVTYGLFGKKKEWRAFVDMLPYRVEFLHRDELTQKQISWLKSQSLPAVLRLSKSKSEVLINGDEFRDIDSLAALQQVLTTRL